MLLQPHSNPAVAAAQQGKKVGRVAGRLFSHALSGYTMSMSAADAAVIRRSPGVLSVEADRPTHAVGQQLGTHLDRVSAPSAAGTVADPSLADGVDDRRVDVDLAILDSGVAAHPDLEVVARADCTGGGACVSGTGTDFFGHGTHVAGIAAAIDNGFGVVGVAPGARIWSVKVLGDGGSGMLSWLIAGMDWVTSRGGVIDVANVSIGCGCVSAATDAALSGSVAAGVAYAVAAGNDHRDATPFAISGNPDAITVSALADFDGVSGGLGSPTCRADQDDTLADFSNWGASVDLTAPGACLTSTYPGPGYAVLSGTSMASPVVAGAAALLASDPAYRGSPTAIRQRLLADGNQAWTDDSGDGVQEPLVDVSSIAPRTLPAASPPGVRVTDPWVVEGANGSVARFTVSTDRPLVGGEYAEVSAATKGGSATAGKDFTTLVSTKIQLTPGHDSQTIDVPVTADSVPESTETFYLDLSEPLGGDIVDSRGTATITDSGGPLTLSVGDTTVPEPASGNGTATVRLTLSAPVPAGQKVTTKVSTKNGTAVAGQDFTAVPATTYTFTAGQQAATVPVTILGDALTEGDEAFSVKVAGTKGATNADATGTVTVLDDEPVRQLSVSDAWVAEGDAGSTPASFTLRLSTPPDPGQSVSVSVKTANGKARAGTDYVAVPKTTVTFGPGTTEQVVQVAVLGDTVAETNETYTLKLTAPVNTSLVDATGLGTIADDDTHAPDPAPRTVSISDERLVESGFGSRTGQVELTLSAPVATGSAVVTVMSSDGTATAGQDYLVVPKTTVTFGPGETAKAVAVAALDDSLPEPIEAFQLAVTSKDVAVADPESTVSVVSDEGPISASAGPVWFPESDAGTSPALVPIQLSEAPGPGQSVSVVATTTQGTASSGADFTNPSPTVVAFGPGQSVQNLAVPVVADALHEGDETFTVKLSTPVGVEVASAQSTVTIVDDEGPISAWVDDPRASEDSGQLRFTVTLDVAPAPGQITSLTAATTYGGTATAGSDYTSTGPVLLTFGPGTRTMTVTVALAPDAVFEPDESVLVTLSAPSQGLSIADSVGTGWVANDD